MTSWMLPTALAVAQHRELRDAARLHQLDGLGRRRFGPTTARARRDPRRSQQVADGLRHADSHPSSCSRPASRRRRICSGNCGRCRGRATTTTSSGASRRA